MSDPPLPTTSKIRTKQSQPPTSSPRTQATTRHRLDSLFATFTSSPNPNPSTPTRSRLWSWLSPSPPKTSQDEDWDEGCFVNGLSGLTVQSEGGLDRLPDEILVQIFSHLPPTPVHLLMLGLVSKRFHAVSQSPVLWQRLWTSNPGPGFHPHIEERLKAIDHPPLGIWAESKTYTTSLRYNSSEQPREEDSSILNNVPIRIRIHYPTLYQSRKTFLDALRTTTPTFQPNFAHYEILSQHTDSVYALKFIGNLLITGSRDKTIRFWRLPPLSKSGYGSKCVKIIDDAHEGSVLAIDFELDDSGKGKGEMITGSSDSTAKVWAFTWAQGEVEVEVGCLGRLTGHQGGVLDVKMTKDCWITCSKDHLLKIYNRHDRSHLRTLHGHTAPINSLSVNPDRAVQQVVSASGDGSWIIWDVVTGEQVLRMDSGGRGLACIEWKVKMFPRERPNSNQPNEGGIKLYSATSGSLIRTYEGHTDLVRSLSLDLNTGMIVSGSYDRSVFMWDFESGRKVRNLEGHGGFAFGVQLLGARVVSVSSDHSVVVTSFGGDLPYIDLYG